MGKEQVHFQAADADQLDEEMNRFINWFNEDTFMDSILKTAVVHFWFATIHPIDDGNGRIALTIAEMQFSRAR